MRTPPQLNVTLKTFMYRKQRHAALRVCYIRINRKTIPHFLKKDIICIFQMFQNISWSQSLWKWYGGPQTQLRLHERSHQGKKAIRWSISLNLLLFRVSAHTLELASFRRFKSIFLPCISCCFNVSWNHFGIWERFSENDLRYGTNQSWILHLDLWKPFAVFDKRWHIGFPELILIKILKTIDTTTDAWELNASSSKMMLKIPLLNWTI